MKKRKQFLEKLKIKMIRCQYPNPAKVFGYPIYGYAMAEIRSVYINKRAPSDTVFHEAAHVLLGHGCGATWRNFYIHEIEAELVAQALCKEFDLQFKNSFLKQYKRKYPNYFKYARKRKIKRVINRLINAYKDVKEL